MTPELSRVVPLARLPQATTVTATEREREALAARLRIPGIPALSCRLALRRHGDTVQADGTLDARVIQTCVASLEPVEQHVAESFTLRFVPRGTEADDDDPTSPDELPYDGAHIDLGEAVAEQLALALDPYPRHPDALPFPDEPPH